MGQADQNYERRIHALSRRERQTSRRRLSLCASPNSAIVGWVEVIAYAAAFTAGNTTFGPVRRAAAEKESFAEKSGSEVVRRKNTLADFVYFVMANRHR